MMSTHYSGLPGLSVRDAEKFMFFGKAAIYAIGPERGRPLKIGMATNIFHRFTTLQISHWERLWIHYVVWTQGKLVAGRIEKECHKILIQNRIRGEWFDIPAQLACDTMHVAADRLKLNLTPHKRLCQQIEHEKKREESVWDDLLSPLFWSRKIPGGA
jgi:hypothetical protein